MVQFRDAVSPQQTGSLHVHWRDVEFDRECIATPDIRSSLRTRFLTFDCLHHTLSNYKTTRHQNKIKQTYNKTIRQANAAQHFQKQIREYLFFPHGVKTLPLTHLLTTAIYQTRPYEFYYIPKKRELFMNLWCHVQKGSPISLHHIFNHISCREIHCQLLQIGFNSEFQRLLFCCRIHHDS